MHKNYFSKIIAFIHFQRRNALNVIKFKVKQVVIFIFVVNAKNFYAIHVSLITPITPKIILLILIDMMLYVNYILIIMDFIAINA